MTPLLPFSPIKARIISIAFLSLFSAYVYGQSVTLYDDQQDNLPGDQGWLAYDAGSSGSASESPAPQGARLTTDGSAKAGYSNYRKSIFLPYVNPSFPDLNDTPESGFALSFQMQMLSESHVRPDRAGFSIILLGKNNRGIELGFWGDRVFAQKQNPLFVHGEEALIDTLSQERNYLLAIHNGTYTLQADGVEILSGSCRDYTAFSGGPFGTGIPYTLPNFVYMGDNTTSAQADVRLGNISLNPSFTPVPEPSSSSCLLLVTLLALTWRGRQVFSKPEPGGLACGK